MKDDVAPQRGGRGAHGADRLPLRGAPIAIAGFVGAGLAALLGGAWLVRLPLAHMALDAYLASRGVDSEFTLERADLGGFRLTDVRLGAVNAPIFTADFAEAKLGWSVLAPHIESLSVHHPVLGGRLDERGLSFGPLDNLFKGGTASGTRQALPPIRVDVQDAQLILDTPLGRVDARGRAQGQLTKDFAAQLSVPTGDTKGQGGEAQGLFFKFSATGAANGVAANLEMAAKSVLWRPEGAPTFTIRNVHMKGEASAPNSLATGGASLTGRMESIRGPAEADGMTFEFAAQASDLGAGLQPRAWTGHVDLAAARIAADGAKASETAFNLAGGGDAARSRGGLSLSVGDVDAGGFAAPKLEVSGVYEARLADQPNLSLDAKIAGSGGRLSAAGRKAAKEAAARFDGTPIAPLIAAATAHLEAGGLTIDAPFHAFWAGPDGSLSIAEPISITSARGGKAIISPLAPVRPVMALALPSGTFTGGGVVVLSGVGLPDTKVDVSRVAGGGGALLIEARADALDWRAPGAALQLRKGQAHVEIDPKTGGEVALGGATIITGPLGEGEIRDARAPLNLTTRWGDSGMRISPAGGQCLPLSAAHIGTPGASLENVKAELCPLDGVFAATDAAGALSGGFSAPAFVWDARFDGGRGTISGGPLNARLSGAADDAIMDFSAARTALDGALPTAEGSPRAFLAALDQIEGRLRFGKAGIAGEGAFSGGELSDGSLPVRLYALGGRWRAIPNGNTTDFVLERVAARLADPAGKMLRPMTIADVSARVADGKAQAQGSVRLDDPNRQLASFSAEHDLSTGVGQAVLRTRDLTFTPEFQPTALSQMALGVIANVSGEAEAEAHAAWGRGPMRLTGSATLRNISLATAGLGPIDGVDGVVRFDDLSQLTTPPGQEVRVRQINPGVAVQDGVLRFQLKPDGIVGIESATWPFAEGVLSVRAADVKLGAPETALALNLRDVDVATLISQLNIKDLTATGKVQGSFPLVFTKDGGRIVHGTLSAGPGGGIIRYGGDLQPGGSANLAFEALRSFRYDALALDLDGELAGDVVTAIRFSGTNQEPVKPAGGFLRATGIPFRFNVTVKAPFVALAQTAASLGDARSLVKKAQETKPTAPPEVQIDAQPIAPPAKNPSPAESAAEPPPS